MWARKGKGGEGFREGGDGGGGFNTPLYLLAYFL